MQARFWHFHNSAVRIKLDPGETVRHSHGGRTDEGYHWEATQYSFDGETVTCEWMTDGRDCDGRMTRHGICTCRVDQLESGYLDQEENIRFPLWQNGESSQRDYSAEAMGY